MLIPGDIHFDKQDDAALEVMLNVAAGRGVNCATLVGDTFESAGMSRHGRPMRKFRFGAGTIKAEERAARPYLDALVKIVTENRDRAGGLCVLTGNHEHWWTGVQDDYPGLVDTPWFELYGDLFDDWHVYAEHTALKFGPLLVCHGHRLRGSLAKYSAASVLANYPGQNTLYGHTHRVDSCTLPTYKYGEQVRHGAWTIGHMRDIEDSITDSFLGPHAEKHIQGFAIVSFHKVGPDIRFNVEQVTIDRDNKGRPYAICGGQLYK
mgnify:CR=1 FL=1